VSHKPNDQRNFVHKKLFGAAKGFLTGGVTGAVGGFLTGGGSKGRPRSTRSADVGIPPRRFSSSKICPEGLTPVPGIPAGTACVPFNSPRAAGTILVRPRGFGAAVPSSLAGSGPCQFPLRRDPLTGQCRLFLGTQSGPDPSPTTGMGPPGTAVVGAFGLPAMEPDIVGTISKRDGSSGPILRCSRGMVLGIDSLCYPKAVMPRRSKFRKWRAAPRPVISARDTKAIRIAASAKERVLNLAKEVGLHASKSRPAPRRKQIPSHSHGGTLRVISEETN